MSESKKVTRLQAYPVDADINIGKQDNVMLVGGYARPCANVADGRAVGRSRRAVNNTGGAAGAVMVEVEEGIFEMTGTGFAQSDVGTSAYANGPQSAAPTQTGNFPALGPIVKFTSPTRVDVRMGIVEGLLTPV